MANELVVDRVVKKYGQHKALDNVSVNIPKGSIYGLLGPNGAGKTTLIRIINQIIKQDEGTVLFQGNSISRDNVVQMGYLPEERGLYRKMKIGEQLLYLAGLKGMTKRNAKEKVQYWLRKLDILNWWNRKTHELSKGMQQKVQFIATILHDPDFIIFDEPFSGFDPINTNLLKNEVLNLKNSGKTIIFSTHNMESVEALCDHISLIHNGKTLIEGQINKVKENYKSNTFEVVYKSKEKNIERIVPDRFRVIDQFSSDDNITVRLKIDNSHDKKLVLNRVMDKYELTSFKELLPSMNDIFIKVVADKETTGL
jgi:ABC-2 type transport system ATP-binding protein